MVIRASCPVSSCGFREICILGFCTGPWQLLLPCGDTSLLYTGTRSNGWVVLRVVQRVARELRRRVNEGSGTRCRKSRKKKKKKTRINLFIRHILLPPFEDPACFLSRASSFSRFYSLDRVLSSFFIRYALPPVQFSPQLESFTLLFLTPASQKSFYTEDSTGSIKEKK